jgi:hypothetical protein
MPGPRRRREEPTATFQSVATIRTPDPDGSWVLTFWPRPADGWTVSAVYGRVTGAVILIVRPGHGNHPATPPNGFYAAPPG